MRRRSSRPPPERQVALTPPRGCVLGTASSKTWRAMGSRLLIPVIMCGGAGTRLWPVSRESMPKQFVPLVEARSTFQQVLGRIGDATLVERPIVITSSDFRFIAAEQMRPCAIAGAIVLEPMRRDSAMAVRIAAVLATARDPASTVIVLAADHVVRDRDAFARA